MCSFETKWLWNLVGQKTLPTCRRNVSHSTSEWRKEGVNSLAEDSCSCLCATVTWEWQSEERGVYGKPLILGERELSVWNMHMGLCRRILCARNCLNAGPASLEWISLVTFGAPVLLEFWWQLDTVAERLCQENSKIAQRLGEKRNEKPAGGWVTLVGVPACSSGMCHWL